MFVMVKLNELKKIGKILFEICSLKLLMNLQTCTLMREGLQIVDTRRQLCRRYMDTQE